MGLGSMPQYAATMGPVPQPAQVGQTSGETSGVERNTGPPIQGQHHAGGPTMSRMTKLKFPRFNGTRLRTLLYKVEQFFSLDNVDYNLKVKVAFVHFDDMVIEWHLAYVRSRDHLPPPSWEESVYALMERFGAEYSDPMTELKLVKQTGSVEEYQKEFDRIMTRLTLPPEYALSSYITGLKPEIGLAVKNHRPHSLP